MKLLSILLVLFLLSFHSVIAQSNLSDYSFVVVPENFEFTSEKDQFQLNSMTKYYLNRSGFNAFFQSELPRVNNCDGLYAEVVSGGSFINTTMIIYLKDCEGAIVFESQEGRSKKKEYRQAYQESLRAAFISIERMNVNQTDIIVDTSASNVARAAAKRLNVEDAVVEVKPIAEIKENPEIPVATTISVAGPSFKFNYFIKENVAYLLRKSNTGYSLYIENERNAMGLVLLGNITRQDGIAYFMKGQLNGVVTFQKNGDLILKERTTTQIFKFQN